MKNAINSVADPATVRNAPQVADLTGSSLTARIAVFLDGGSHGEELLHALYDHILDEPLPQRMRALLAE